MTENTRRAYERDLLLWDEITSHLSDSQRSRLYYALREGIIPPPRQRTPSPPRDALSQVEYNASLAFLREYDYDLYLFARTIGDLGVEPFQIIEKQHTTNALTTESIKWVVNAWFVDLPTRGGGTVRYAIPKDLADELRSYQAPPRATGRVGKPRTSMWAVGAAAMNVRLKHALDEMESRRIVRRFLKRSFDLWRKAPIERMTDDPRWRDFRGVA